MRFSRTAFSRNGFSRNIFDLIAPDTASPFATLCRAFFAQFFTSESATSDAHVRQTMIWALTFLLPPGLFMMVTVFPDYENIVRFHPAQIDEARMRLALVFVTYAMVTAGFVAVFVWDGLTFERRDAMVLGPLPLRGSTVIGAKLSALALLMLGASFAINLMTALPFASVTANHLGLASFVHDGTAHLIATIGGAAFVFCTLVVTRALVMLLGSPRLAARLGSLLQFLFVAAILCFMLLAPAMLQAKRAAFLASAGTSVNPSAWFLGLFEYLHGSPEPVFATLARRALLALALAMSGSVALSIVGVRLQMQRALVPVSSAGALGRALVSRALARLLTGRDPIAQATADFVLLTIARNRAQQGPIAVTAAIGLAIVIARLAAEANELGWMMRPTIDVLAVPLVLAFWMTIGLRAACFVPSELPAAWAFRVNAPERGRSYWSATRAAMIAFVLPPMLLVTALLGPLLGARIAAWHALFVMAMIALLVQILLLTIAYVPFTRAYEPGHARLRTRWPLYLIGVYAFAYWPLGPEMRLLTATAAGPRPLSFLGLLAGVAAAIAVLDAIGRRRAAAVWRIEEPESSVEDSLRISVLDIGDAVPGVRLASKGSAPR
jgi:hypothetical protein